MSKIEIPTKTEFFELHHSLEALYVAHAPKEEVNFHADVLQLVVHGVRTNDYKAKHLPVRREARKLVAELNDALDRWTWRAYRERTLPPGERAFAFSTLILRLATCVSTYANLRRLEGVDEVPKMRLVS